MKPTWNHLQSNTMSGNKSWNHMKLHFVNRKRDFFVLKKIVVSCGFMSSIYDIHRFWFGFMLLPCWFRVVYNLHCTVHHYAERNFMQTQAIVYIRKKQNKTKKITAGVDLFSSEFSLSWWVLTWWSCLFLQCCNFQL